MALLLRERRLERGDRALALRVRLLVLERCLDVRAAPARRVLRDLGDRHVLVALRRVRGARRRFGLRRGGLRLLRRSLRRGFGLRLLRCGLRRSLARAGPDRLDLDLRQARAEAGVLAIAGAALVLADADLVAERVADDARRHRRRRREIGLAFAADEQDARIERLALVGLQAVDEQPLALPDAVLLAADGDDRVAHVVENARPRPNAGAARAAAV